MTIHRVKTFRFRLPLAIMLFLISAALTAQSKSEMRKIFAKAESHFLFEEYDLANQLYLLLETPDNFNLKYKIGTCYLNIADEEEKAIPYLETAVRNASYRSRTASLREKKAPLDAWFFLGKAYMKNNQLEKAIATFENFKRLATGPEVKGEMKNLAFVDQQIEACRNASVYQSKPVPLTMITLGSNLNQGSVNENPAISFDGNTLVYTERRGIVNVIFFTRKVGGAWQDPVDITDDLNAGDDCSSCSLNHDGTQLFLYKTDNFTGNIYSSNFVNGRWTPIRKLNSYINTRFFESHASVSADGRRLYFSSNRPGGLGGLDIYVSEKDLSGDWGQPVNLGATINTPFNEDTPFITLNDSLLYFSSEGHHSMGGYDNFSAVRKGQTFGKPVNLGSPVNSTGDDRFFNPFNNGKKGYYSVRTDYKKRDIFLVDFTVAGPDRVFEIRGFISLRDTVASFDSNYPIYLTDRNTADTLETGYPDSSTGLYTFIVPAGEFRIHYTAPGFFTHTADTAIKADSYIKVFNIDVTLEPDPGYYYEPIDLTRIPAAEAIEPGILVSDLKLSDLTDADIKDSEILYYTVQVMALYNPVDISYFRYVSDIKVIYNENDLFYRYTTGVFSSRDEAYAHRNDLVRKGYPDDLFIRKVSRIPGDRDVREQVYFTIQMKATRVRLDMRTVFRGYTGVRETEEIDGLYHYLYGKFDTFAEAASVLKDVVRNKEFEDAFVREVKVLIR